MVDVNLEDIRRTVKAELEAAKDDARQAAAGFWKTHGKVALVAFGAGFALAIALAVVGVSIGG